MTTANDNHPVCYRIHDPNTGMYTVKDAAGRVIADGLTLITLYGAIKRYQHKMPTRRGAHCLAQVTPSAQGLINIYCPCGAPQYDTGAPVAQALADVRDAMQAEKDGWDGQVGHGQRRLRNGDSSDSTLRDNAYAAQMQAAYAFALASC